MDGSNIIDTGNTLTGDMLLAFVERIEAEREVQAESKAREKEIFAELKGAGFMARPVRTIIKHRATDPEKLAEEEAILGLYKSALGMV